MNNGKKLPTSTGQRLEFHIETLGSAIQHVGYVLTDAEGKRETPCTFPFWWSRKTST